MYWQLSKLNGHLVWRKKVPGFKMKMENFNSRLQRYVTQSTRQRQPWRRGPGSTAAGSVPGVRPPPPWTLRPPPAPWMGPPPGPALRTSAKTKGHKNVAAISFLPFGLQMVMPLALPVSRAGSGPPAPGPWAGAGMFALVIFFICETRLSVEYVPGTIPAPGVVHLEH